MIRWRLTLIQNSRWKGLTGRLILDYCKWWLRICCLNKVYKRRSVRKNRMTRRVLIGQRWRIRVHDGFTGVFQTRWCIIYLRPNDVEKGFVIFFSGGQMLDQMSVTTSLWQIIDYGDRCLARCLENGIPESKNRLHNRIMTG